MGKGSGTNSWNSPAGAAHYWVQTPFFPHFSKESSTTPLTLALFPETQDYTDEMQGNKRTQWVSGGKQGVELIENSRVFFEFCKGREFGQNQLSVECGCVACDD